MTALPLYPQRPRTRGECADVPRPCPFVSCRYHLLLQVGSNGRIFATRGEDPTEMTESCALDVADRGPAEAGKVATLLGLDNPQNIYVAEASARAKFERAGLRELVAEDARARREVEKPSLQAKRQSFTDGDIGRRFGMLVVVGLAGRNHRGNRLVNVVCDCGKTLVVRGVSLATDHTRSCGCRRVSGYMKKKKEAA